MKITHVVTGLTKANGVSVFVCELAAEQAAQGHDVTILVASRGDDFYPVNPRVKVIVQKDLTSIVHLHLFSSPSSSEAPTIVHIHALWSPWLTKCARLAKKAGRKVVWSPHGMLTPWALKNKWYKKVLGLALYQYWSLRKADMIHVTAQSEVADVRRLGLRNRLVVAPLGVRVGKLAKRVPSFAKSTEGQGVGELKEKVLLFVSRVQRKKGLPCLMEAWARLPEEVKTGWTIRIVGPDQDGHTAELMRQCESLGLSYSDPKGNIHSPTRNSHLHLQVAFVGPKYGEDLDAEYRNADLFVLPTHSENFGSVVIEALARGVPVVCTKGAPWEDLVTHRCGWWCDDCVDALKDALADALSCTEREAMGMRGRALVELKYTWRAVAGTIVDAYAALLG